MFNKSNFRLICDIKTDLQYIAIKSRFHWIFIGIFISNVLGIRTVIWRHKVLLKASSKDPNLLAALPRSIPMLSTTFDRFENIIYYTKKLIFQKIKFRFIFPETYSIKYNIFSAFDNFL